jgi:transposase
MVKITKQKFKDAVEGTGGILTHIAKNLGVSRKAVYDYMERFPETILLKDQEEEKILDMAEASLFQQTRNGEQWATKYLLATKGKKRGYIESREVKNETTLKGDGIKFIIEDCANAGNNVETQS